MKLTKTLATFVLTFASMGVFAQWQWIDNDGRKIFSDRGPGPDIPEKNILKRPAGSKPLSTSSAASEATPSSSAAPVAGQAPKDTGIDKELDAKKKQAEAAEAAKRKAEDERMAKAKADNCRTAKQAKITYDSGIRIARTNAAGEREILDDAAKAAEAQRIETIIRNDCP